jgi:hypothetical protein
MNSQQDSQLNRGRCSYSPKPRVTFVVEDEEVNPYPTPEQTEPQIEDPLLKPEITDQRSITLTH